MSNKIGIIDYGLCNLLNVKNAIKYLGANAEIIDTPESIENQSHIILPGVGAFKNGIWWKIPNALTFFVPRLAT